MADHPHDGGARRSGGPGDAAPDRRDAPDPHDLPDLHDVGPSPPGVRELQELSPYIDASARRVRRRWVRWLAIDAAVIALGLLLVTLGGCRVDAHARALLDEQAAAGIEPGVVRPGWGPIEAGPADADTAVLLVHGFRSTPNDFGPLPAALAERGLFARAMLLPGHGTSARELAGTEWSEWVDAVRAEYAALRARHERVHVVGFSMGAACALVALAEDQPDRLALVAPYLRVTPRWWLVARPEFWNEVARLVVDYADSGPTIRGISDPELAEDFPFYRVLPLAAVSQAAALAERARDRELLAAYTVPTLALVSDRDTVADPRAARAAFEALGSDERRLVRYDASNHVLLWDAEADAVLAELVTFLTSPDAPTPANE